MTNDKTTYELYVFCTNCLSRNKMEIPKGVPVHEVSCPNCGNLTLENDPNGEILSRPHKQDIYR